MKNIHLNITCRLYIYYDIIIINPSAIASSQVMPIFFAYFVHSLYDSTTLCASTEGGIANANKEVNIMAEKSFFIVFNVLKVIKSSLFLQILSYLYSIKENKKLIAPNCM